MALPDAHDLPLRALHGLSNNALGLAFIAAFVVFMLAADTLSESKSAGRRKLGHALFGLFGLALIGWFVAMGLDMSRNPSGRVIRVFPVDATHVAMLREKTWSRGGANSFGGPSTVATNYLSWTLVMIDPTTGKSLATTKLFETSSNYGMEGGKWAMRAGPDHLFVDGPPGLMRLDLRTGAMDDEAALRNRAPQLQKPWGLGEQGLHEEGGYLVIHDREMRWWRLHGDLHTEPTSESAEVVSKRDPVDSERFGCTSTREAHFLERDGRSRFKLWEKRISHHGPGPESEPEGNLLRPELVVDRVRHCAVDTQVGGVVLSRQDIRANAPWLLSLAKAEGGELAWGRPMGELCGGFSDRPTGARLMGGDLLLSRGGELCMVDLAAGKMRWRVGPGALTTDERAGELKLLRLEADGPLLDAWFAGEVGSWVHARIDPATGAVDRQIGRS